MAKKTIKTNKKVGTKKIINASVNQTVTPVKEHTSSNILDKFQLDLQHNQSYLNLILGGLILIVSVFLVFNYFNKPKGEIGLSQQTTSQPEQKTDVSKNQLPGKYAVKEGDTLFTIAQAYYDDGYKYPMLVQANKITDENTIEKGQVLNIPKLEADSTKATTDTTTSPMPKTSNNPVTNIDNGQGGAINETIWGEKIAGDTYTVQADDWLSKISGRAYGDIYQFDKIAKANNISDVNSIEPGIVLKIPR